MNQSFKVRSMASQQYEGWIARAKLRGLRVSSRPIAFGREAYIVKDGQGNAVAFNMDPHVNLGGELVQPGAGARELLARLVELGIVYLPDPKPAHPKSGKDFNRELGKRLASYFRP